MPESPPKVTPPLDQIEALLVEAYQRGWREGCETLIEDYPDAVAPHKDAMGEGCGTFMGEVYPRIEDVLFRPTEAPQAEVTEEMLRAGDKALRDILGEYRSLLPSTFRAIFLAMQAARSGVDQPMREREKD